MEVSFTQNGNASNTPCWAEPSKCSISALEGRSLGSSSLLASILFRTKNNGGLEERGERGSSRRHRKCFGAHRGLANLSHREPVRASKAAGRRGWGTNNSRKLGVAGGRGRALGGGGALAAGFLMDREAQPFLWERASGALPRWWGPPLQHTPGPFPPFASSTPPQRFYFYFDRMQKSKAEFQRVEIY